MRGEAPSYSPKADYLIPGSEKISGFCLAVWIYSLVKMETKTSSSLLEAGLTEKFRSIDSPSGTLGFSIFAPEAIARVYENLL